MTLKKIVEEMKEEAKRRGHSLRTSSGGLRVALYERKDDTVLVLSRPGGLVVPSDKEIEICKDAFFGDEPLKEVAGETIVWSGRKCFLAVEKM